MITTVSHAKRAKESKLHKKIRGKPLTHGALSVRAAFCQGRSDPSNWVYRYSGPVSNGRRAGSTSAKHAQKLSTRNRMTFREQIGPVLHTFKRYAHSVPSQNA